MDVIGHQFSPEASRSVRYVALTGNPNCGKTTLFNALTGLRAKVGNYAGVTVERKEGRLLGPKTDAITVIDLPGTYSLSPQSLDEQISRDVLFNWLPEVPAPDAVIVVVDASNLQRNLYYATQVIELGYPTIVALNMMDVARTNGHLIDTEELGRRLGVPVVALVANRGEGVQTLTTEIVRLRSGEAQADFCQLPSPMAKARSAVAAALAREFPQRARPARAEALLLLSDEKFLKTTLSHYPAVIQASVADARARLEKEGIDWRSVVIEARYAALTEIQEASTTETMLDGETTSDKLDRVFTHRFWGLLIFLGIMTLMFQSIFSFAQVPMDLIGQAVDWVGNVAGGMMGPGPLNDLLVKGVIKGVGAVVVFLPQICLLFLFIGLLEDTGYMARAAFLMDRLMSKVGLHGKSFIPMLSSFACAIPGIMATRTIESAKDRLVTILVAPLMSCSARLPVYTVLIAACIPRKTILGFLKLPGLTLLAMYLLGIIVALFMAWLFKRTILKGPTPMLIMELPPYKRPLLRTVLRHMWERSRLFLRRAGTVILGLNILLWFLMSYPGSKEREQAFAARKEAAKVSAGLNPTSEQTKKLEVELGEIGKDQAGEKLRQSFAGRLGHLIEPALRPLGFDWKIGVGIVASFAAREVFVSTMSLVYNVGEYERSAAATSSLATTMQRQTSSDGRLVYTPLVAVSLMVFYVFALQCVSTVAIVRRETNSWKWPLFQWIYMGTLAWVLAFCVYQGGRFLGWH